MGQIKHTGEGTGRLRVAWAIVDGRPLSDAQWKLVAKTFSRIWQGINAGIIINESGLDKLTFAKDRTVNTVNRTAVK